MSLFHSVALVLICLFSYSSGAVLRWRRAPEIEPSPELADLLVVALGAVAVLILKPHLGHWLSIPAAIMIGGASGLTLQLVPGRAAVVRTDPSAEDRWSSESGWRFHLEQIGNYQGRLLMLVLYFALFTPLAPVLRLVHDPLRRRPRSEDGAHWVRRDPGPDSEQEFRRPF